jgi:hypothetical protein
MLSCPTDKLDLRPRRFREAIFLQQGEIPLERRVRYHSNLAGKASIA